MGYPKRWMTRDFVVTPPAGFEDVRLSDLEHLELRAHPAAGDQASLFVWVRDGDGAIDPDAAFASVADDLLGMGGTAWSPLVPVQVLGYEALHGTTIGSPDSDGAETAGLTLARGRAGCLWAFGWRTAAGHRALAETAYADLMQSLQVRPDRIGEKTLRMQFQGQERAQQAGIDAATDRPGGTAEPGPDDPAWERRLAAVLGEDDPAAVAPLIAAAVALVEAPFGEPAPLGASRIGGGPDIPASAWPSNAQGLRHPFLMQVDLADVAAICGSTSPLPKVGLLSFFVHDDALLVDVVHTPPGTRLERHPIDHALVEASQAAVAIACDLPADAPAGPLPHSEGDIVTVEVMPDGTLRFAHVPDPVWAVGEPGQPFDALSDERWASVASARLVAKPTRSFDVAAAERSIGEEEYDAIDALHELNESFEDAQVGSFAAMALPQRHQLLGHARLEGHGDLREVAAEAAVSAGHVNLGDPGDWIVLVRVRAGSVTGREFWDADDLVVLAPLPDVAKGRWDRCVLVPG